MRNSKTLEKVLIICNHVVFKVLLLEIWMLIMMFQLKVFAKILCPILRIMLVQVNFNQIFIQMLIRNKQKNHIKEECIITQKIQLINHEIEIILANLVPINNSWRLKKHFKLLIVQTKRIQFQNNLNINKNHFYNWLQIILMKVAKNKKQTIHLLKTAIFLLTFKENYNQWVSFVILILYREFKKDKIRKEIVNIKVATRKIKWNKYYSR